MTMRILIVLFSTKHAWRVTKLNAKEEYFCARFLYTLFYKNHLLSAQTVLSYFLPIFPNSRLVPRNNKRALRNTYLLLLHPAESEKKLKLSIWRSRTLQACLQRPMIQLILTNLCKHGHLNQCSVQD